MDEISSIVTMFNRLCIAMAYQQRYHKSLTWGSWAVFSAQTVFLSCRVKFLGIAAAASLALARAYDLDTLLL